MRANINRNGTKANKGTRKSLVLALVVTMILSMVPADIFAYTNYPCETDKADAELYPFPIDMSVLSNYLYGSEANLEGKVRWKFNGNVPKEWYTREMPNSLGKYWIGNVVINNRYRGSRSAATIYFYPGNPSINYHSKRIEELSKTKYKYRGPNNPSNANTAFMVAETTEFKMLGYNSEWVAVWDVGGIDESCGIGSTCGGIGTEQYGSWKPGVYFIKRKDCYITDIRNCDLNITPSTASATATCNTYIKTTPAKDNYVMAGMMKTNEMLQVTNTTPINGHYQIYFKDGLYYVNADWVNLKRSDENKPDMQYTATVKTTDPVNITSGASASSSIEGKAKDKFEIQVVKKDAGNGFSEVWFNSKTCYMPTSSLSEFIPYRSYPAVKKLGKAKGTLVMNGPWSANGETAYSPEAFKILKKYRMDEGAAYKKINAINGFYHMSEGDTATVYSVSKYTYKSTINPKYKETVKVYKLVFDGKVCYTTNGGHQTFRYYAGSKYKKKVKSETKYFTVYKPSKRKKNAGRSVAVESYKINGRYYYKIDDIASTLSVAHKSISVDYVKGTSKTNDAIIISSMSPYKGTAPLKKGDEVQRYAYLTMTTLVWDGEVLGIPCYKINGYYYVDPEYFAMYLDSEYGETTGGWYIDPTMPYHVEAYG